MAFFFLLIWAFRCSVFGLKKKNRGKSGGSSRITLGGLQTLQEFNNQRVIALQFVFSQLPDNSEPKYQTFKINFKK